MSTIWWGAIMQKEDSWKTLISQQKEVTERIEKEIVRLKSEDFVVENEALREELTKCKTQLAEFKQQVSVLSDENRKLKDSLYEQIYNEKIAILNAVSKKVEAYYHSSVNGEMNRLKMFENDSKHRINNIVNILKLNRIDDQDEIFSKIEELRELLDYKLAEARRNYAEQEGAYKKNHQEQYRKLHEESVSQEEMKRALKKNNIESLIGLNIINKLGILLLIIGIITLTQFTYFRLPDVLKTILVFLGGGILLVVGELINRKKPNVFSLGLTSGGVAVLYVGVAISYFALNTISMYPALVLCIAITALSFYLSQRYESQTIAAFSLVGGYLPILSIAADDILVYSAMVYFIILNLLLLSIAFRRKWSIAAFIGFAFNVFATAYIMELNLNLFSTRPDYISAKDLITILYILLAFLIYTLIPIAGAYFDKKKMSVADGTLLVMNTYISAIFMYVAFFQTGFYAYTGVLALLFAATYYFLSKFVSKRLPEEKMVEELFTITSFTFIVLFIPLQLEIVWLSLGWLIEGVLLIVYGIIKDNKKLRKYGYIVYSMCLGIFYVFDVFFRLIGENQYFIYKYLFITLGSIAIIFAYLYKKTLASKSINKLKYYTYINLWLFIFYMIGIELANVLKPLFINSSININYLINGLCISLGFLLAYIVPRIKLLNDKIMRQISMTIYGVSIFWLMILNMVGSPIATEDITLTVTIIATAIILVINLLSILAVIDLLRGLVLEHELGIELYPLIVSIYFLVILTQNLTIQYELDFSNFMISIIYILLSLALIIFGFVKRYSYIRRFGLGLTCLAMAKLFLIDLSILTMGFRIISYFAFGVILIAISFVYQYFSKRLEGYVISEDSREESD